MGMTKVGKLWVTVDGSCIRGRMGVGVAIRLDDADQVTDTVSKSCGYGTNNQAEYLAVIEACRYAHKKYKYEALLISTDSQLVFRQLKGEYRVKNQELRKLHTRTIDAMMKAGATLRWHSREDGDGPAADKLANQAGGKGGTRH